MACPEIQRGPSPLEAPLQPLRMPLLSDAISAVEFACFCSPLPFPCTWLLLLPRSRRHEAVLAVVSHQISEVAVAVRDDINPPLQLLRIGILFDRSPYRDERCLYLGHHV